MAKFRPIGPEKPERMLMIRGIRPSLAVLGVNL